LADNHRVEEPGVGEPHAHSAKPYILVWVALIFFTGLTYYTGKAHLGTWALPLALSIATIKAVLVALFFMHLWEDRGPNRLVLATAVLFVLLLVGITLTDVATRFNLDTPSGAPFGVRIDFAEGNESNSPSGSPAGSPAHDGPHPGADAPSEGGLPHRERSAQDPSRP
jgi:cytochrome c oxidase subunit IV